MFVYTVPLAGSAASAAARARSYRGRRIGRRPYTYFAESYHTLLKRGIIGAFHHVSDKHLPRYLAEFDRRWNTRNDRDGARTVDVIGTAIGKRLTYKATIA